MNPWASVESANIPRRSQAIIRPKRTGEKIWWSGTPCPLLSEIDAEGWEVRKVELFRDGRLGFADGSESAEGTRSGQAPVPEFHEIAAMPEFSPEEIDRHEFNRIWDHARSVLRPG